MAEPSAIRSEPPAPPEPRPAVRRYRVLDEDTDDAYDDVIELALAITGRTMGAIVFVEGGQRLRSSTKGIDPHDHAEAESLCARVAAADEPVVVEDLARTCGKGGDGRLRSFAGVPLRTPDDRLSIGALCVFDDRPGEFTDRERAALQTLVRSTMRHLQARQNEADLETARQNEARRQRAQRLETLGRFVGGVAHDFNNLLAVISLASDLLVDRVDDQLAPALTEIRAATDAAASMTRQLLAFSRGGSTVRYLVSLNAAVEDMRPLLQRIVGSARLETRLQSELPMVAANHGLVGRVLLNLLMNASDAMGGDGVATIVTSGLTPAQASELGVRAGSAESYVALSVSDNGEGMSLETSGRAFDPFFTTKGQGRGTGFGLSTVQNIARQLGGEVLIESVVGVGTTVTMLLPSAGEALSPGEHEREDARVGGEMLLVVDKEGSNRDLVSDLLVRAGYRVMAAKDGAEARLLCRDAAEPVDLVVSDVALPDGSGYELLEELRAQRPAIRAVFISGDAKPFGTPRLLEAVREQLDA